MSSSFLTERLTPHIHSLIDGGSEGIARQYKKQPVSATNADFSNVDPLGEDSKYLVGKGLIRKFVNRLLWKVTYRCAAHCQFCTRHRQIGSPAGDLSEADLHAGLRYARAHPDIDDVILSGGDPLYVPETTRSILLGLEEISTVSVIRIGTRLPIQAPKSLGSAPLVKLLEVIKRVRERKAIYVLLHINHPDELTADVLDALASLRNTGATLLSQTVFLRSINDSKETLGALFRMLFSRGIVPYYIFRCDPVSELEEFVVDAELERQIVSDLTRELSGIAVPTYIVDVEGRGKIPVPLDFWEGTDLSACLDYDGRSTKTYLR